MVDAIIPDFMIIGAPKCGTTALCEYLSSHPDICFSESKEPNYFCTDFPGYRNSFSIEEYLTKEFSHCDSSSISAVGEGSVCYLYSETAVDEIMKFNPETKLIVMLRNPVEVVQALHSQMLRNLDEDISDFDTAWSLQERRALGHDIPRLCREPKFLQYRDFALFGEQIGRLYQKVPLAQVKIILFSDFIRETRQTYLDVLGFIGVQDDGRINFPRVNINKVNRSRFISRIIHRPPKWLSLFIRRIKILAGIKRIGIYKLISGYEERVNTQSQPRAEISTVLYETILASFMDDISRLEQLIGKDLGDWKKL